MPLAVIGKVVRPRAFTVLLLAAATSAAGQTTKSVNRGVTSDFDLHPLDVFAAFNLPAPPDAPDSPLGKTVATLQVGSRAAALGLSGKSPVNAWKAAQSLLVRNAPVRLPRFLAGTIVFSGKKASDLTQLIATSTAGRIEVVSAILSVDQPIEISRANLTLDFGSTEIFSASLAAYMLRIENTSQVTVLGGVFAGGDSAILVNSALAVTLSGIQIENLTGAGITVTDSTGVNVKGNVLSGLGLCGIMIHRNTTGSIVQQNQISNGSGFSNMMAGVVITDREVDLTQNPRAILGSDGYWVISQPMMERLSPPHNNLIAWNTVSRGVASGIYSDGGVGNVIFGNTLQGNSKEGLCLDNGSTANVVASNNIFDNGERWGDPDWVLAEDSILAGGRLSNGTAAEKVPGISVDNAIYNVVFENNVAHNFGGGIKIVRTGYFNAIGLNTILYDNDGAGPIFHFFGIELGAASGSSPELDFTPSHGNVVFSNSIRGSHYSGVFFDPGSDVNTIMYNVILDAGAWAIESAQQMSNTSLNNLTNLPSRNIGSGLNPTLVTQGEPVDDPPLM